MIEDEIRIAVKNNKYINWYYICICDKLSEDFIREFSEEVNWKNISWYQNLSEEFIIEFADKVSWRDICWNKKISKKIIKEFSHKLHYKYIPLCFFKINHEQSWETFF